MGGQLQIYEMIHAGMSYINDPKQFIFTLNQTDVVVGVLNGKYDVAFVQTGKIEETRDEKGDYIDPKLFKILEPRTHALDDGMLFPFYHSTEVFGDWPFAALPGVPGDVQAAVQSALIEFGTYVDVGEEINECMASKANTNESSCDLSRLSTDGLRGLGSKSNRWLSNTAVVLRASFDTGSVRTVDSNRER